MKLFFENNCIKLGNLTSHCYFSSAWNVYHQVFQITYLHPLCDCFPIGILFCNIWKGLFSSLRLIRMILNQVEQNQSKICDCWLQALSFWISVWKVENESSFTFVFYLCIFIRPWKMTPAFFTCIWNFRWWVY